MRFLNIVLIFSLFIAVPALGEDIIVSYPTKEGVYYTESQPDAFQLRTDGNYAVSAYIKFITEEKERIFNKYQIDLAKILKKDSLSVKTEMTDEGLLILNKEGYSGKDEIKFTLPLPEKGIRIEKYPSFQIRYQKLNPFVPFDMDIIFYLDTNNDGKIDTTVFAKTPEAISEKLVKEIDFKKVDFVSKSYSYLLYRKLGIMMDEKWRYAQNGEDVIIQRRFYEDLREVPVIKLFFDKDCEVTRINFMVDFNGNQRPDATIEFEDTLHHSLSKGDLKGIEIDLLASVKRLFPQKRDIFLTEVFIFVRGSKENILREMPLKSLCFYHTGIKGIEKSAIFVQARPEEEDKRPEGEFEESEKKEEDLEANKGLEREEKTLKVDLSELGKENIHLGNIKRAQLILDFSKNAPTGILLKDVMFYNPAEKECPVLLNAIKERVREFGIGTDTKQTLIVPEIKFYQDFCLRPKGIGEWFIRGVRVPDIHVERSLKGLKVTYKNIDLKIDKDTYFLCDYQGEQTIAYLNLWEQNKKQGIRFPLPPGIPVKIGNRVEGKKNIKKMSIVLTTMPNSNGFFEKHWECKLKKFLCFSAVKMQEIDFLNTYLANLEPATWLPFNKFSSSTGTFFWEQGDTANIVWHPSFTLPLNFVLRAQVDRKIKDMPFLSFGYEIDPDLAKLNPSWLEINIGLKSKDGVERYSLRPSLDEDEAWVNLPLGEGLRHKNILWIEFNVHIEKISGFKTYLFKIRGPYISKTFMASLISNLLGKERLAQIDNHEIKTQTVLEALYNEPGASRGLLNGGVWVNLGEFYFSEGKHEVEFVPHEYLKIDALLLKAETPISVASIPSETPKKSLSQKVLHTSLKALLVGLILFCFYLGYHFRRFYLFIWHKLARAWSFVPLWLKLIIFPTVGLYFYVLGLEKKVGEGGNYFFTCGGILFAFGYHYLSLILKPWWLKHHKKIGFFLYKSSGSIYIIGFMITLIIAALFLVFGIEPLADQVAVIGYYLLVAGVIKEFLEFRQST